jgi:hypothetical protein
MKVSESLFVQALTELVWALAARDGEGLNQLIEPESIHLLQEIAENLDDSNVVEKCAECTEIILTIGNVRGGQMVDDLDSLQSVWHHLGTMYQNPICPEGAVRDNLGHALGTTVDFVNRKFEAFAAYVGR